MKFGIYHHPSTNYSIRCINGVFTLIRLEDVANVAPEAYPAALWNHLENNPGIPCDQSAIRSKLASSGSLSTYCRSVAKVLYAVPDDVELYVLGDFGVNA